MKSRTMRPGWAIASAVIAALVVKTFVLDAAIVDGTSMMPLLRQGSVVLVLRCAYGFRFPSRDGYLVRWKTPRRGDIVVARSPRDGSAVVKRVAAVGPIELPIVAGRLLGPGLDLPLSPERWGDRIVVEPGWLFLVGDNAQESVDSRDYGSVPIEAIAGRVVLFARWRKTGASG
ncbi:MAG: signal peptidase I [Spirochaetaceae bacterium]|nr:signal peptidase I [Spirochaetaceae bacterium]